jgi:hypothetical protein
MSSGSTLAAELNDIDQVLSSVGDAITSDSTVVVEADDVVVVDQPVFLYRPPVTKPSLVFEDWLFVGTYVHASSKDILDELNIKYIVDVEQGGKKAGIAVDDDDDMMIMMIMMTLCNALAVSIFFPPTQSLFWTCSRPQRFSTRRVILRGRCVTWERRR